VIGSVPFFLGLTVVFPVLGHAMWHLYRKAVEPDPDPHPDYQPRDRRITGLLPISPPCSSRRGGRRCRLRLGSFRRVANVWLNFATIWVDSELLIRMRIGHYGSPMRFASGQSSDLGILNLAID
jgi:hypothetical protein